MLLLSLSDRINFSASLSYLPYTVWLHYNVIHYTIEVDIMIILTENNNVLEIFYSKSNEHISGDIIHSLQFTKKFKLKYS